MKVGWIGVGNMGNPMAGHVLAAGHDFKVHDLRQEAAANLLESGAKWAASPAEAAEGVDVVMMSLPMPHHVEAVCLGENGVLEAIVSDTVVLDLSTNSVSMVRRLNEAFMEDKGVQFLDCPVSGGVTGARARDLCVMVGGDEATFERVRPVLDDMGDKVMYCGPIGAGSVCKLANQIAGLMISQSVLEVLTMGVKAGVPLTTLADAISKSSGGKNPPFRGWKTGRVETDFEADELTFYLELGRKDCRLACELGRELDVPMEIANIVEQRMIEGMNRGWGRKKLQIIRTIQEERAGVKLG